MPSPETHSKPEAGSDTFSLERWLVPGLLLAFCATAYWLTTTFKKMPPILKRGIQPSDFPQLLILLLVFLTVLMVWKDPIRIKDRLQNSTIGTILLFGVFAALTSIDFFLALGIFAAILAAFWGERRPMRLALVGLIVPAAIFFTFDMVFEIRFPRGLLTNIWYG